MDDDDDTRESISDVLKLDGHRVVAVANGEQAIGALAVAKPGAIVTDLSMPVRTGHGLIEHLRRHDRTQLIPVCVVSAEVSAAPEGTLVIKKPFGLSELRATLRQALGRDV